MTFEDQISKLAEEAVSCTSEEQAVELTHRLQVLMHRRIESLREDVTAMASVGCIVQGPDSSG